MSRECPNEEPNLLRGVFAGVVGGLVASWVMNQYFVAVAKATEATTEQPQQQDQKEGEDSTQLVADAIASRVIGRHLDKEEKEKAGPIVHYAFGALMGGVYGGIAEYSSSARTGFGTLFGSVLFVGAHEIAVPALGFGKPPTQQPVSDQLSHWVGHMVYGATVELVRFGVRQIL
jgi:putative membrane protein